ncbi:MAG: hypothetical protein GY913_06145 [Proteobacteria bacterium]|nr:hypothetical protein [Pseudomonadota bacterium]MCP4916487.1 hypothetical protein [Pseudomonadota bacterium]
MARVVVVTDNEELRLTMRESLVRSGHAVRTAGDWDGLVRELSSPACRLMLVDGRLPGLLPEPLAGLAASLSHAPQVRTIRAPAPPLVAITSERIQLLANRLVGRLAREDRRELRLLGLGRDTFRVLDIAGAAELPVLIVGEQGTGKKRVARALHARSGSGGPLVAVSAVPEGPAGTLYVPEAGQRDLESLAEACQETGWRLCAGSRVHLALPTWRHVALAPLRARPDELRRLVNLYLERYRARLGLPRRRFDRALWRLVRAHRWPGNARELEGFVVQALTSTRGDVVRASALPPRVRALVDRPASASLVEHADKLQDVAEGQLQELVDGLEPGSPVHRAVTEATERALIKLTLRRTGGDQKAAAELLGVARNTLRAKAIRFGLIEPRPRGTRR